MLARGMQGKKKTHVAYKQIIKKHLRVNKKKKAEKTYL